jgi:predicted metal-binding protein
MQQRCDTTYYRNEDEDALDLEETRTAMKFSMGCMKTQTIPLGDEVITFAPETAEIMREVRKLYISGFKEQNEEDYEEFMRASVANLNAIGRDRMIRARQVLFDELYEIPQHCLDWGLSYIFGLMKWR